MKHISYTEILKTKINILTMPQTVRYLDEHLTDLSGQYICVANVHTTVSSYRDPAYRRVQNESALNLPDGKPLSLVQRYRGYHEAGRVPGPDLMPELFALSEKRGYSHYFYGSSPETIRALEVQLRRKYPELKLAGFYSPPYRPLTEEEDAEVTRRIREADPDFIWIGLGAPKQEFWMAEHAGRFRGVMLGVGAGFDFHAGTVKRAPKWVQECCMEWLYRLVQDPSRLLWRYLDTNFSFLYYLFREEWNRRGEKRNSGLSDGKQSPSADQTEAVRKASRNMKKRAAPAVRPLKIAMVGQKRIPSREGGVEVVVDELATRYVKLGHQVDAYNRSGYHVSGKEFDESRGKIYEGVRLITIPTFKSSSLNAIVYSILASFRLLFGGYDVVHYHAEGPCTMLWLPRLFGIPVVATIHGLDWQRSKWGGFATAVLKFGERMAARQANAVIVLSRNVQDYFLQTYGRKTLFIPNGVSRPKHAEADVIREKYGLEKDGYILFLARIVPEKGLHYLIEAFHQVKTDKKLVIAGGVSHSQDYMNKIRTMAAMDERILMTDFVQGRMLEELCSNAALFVLPSDVEGMAVTLLEAMSYGNCCLVSDIRENTEVVGEYALTFQKGNAADLREKLQMLMDHPEIRQRYRERSADYICDRYHWDDVVNRTLYVYEKCRENAESRKYKFRAGN